MEIPHGFFLNTPGNSTSFLIDPWNFYMFFLQFPWKLHVLKPRCLDFFWNSLFEVVLILNFTFVIFCCHGATVTLRFHDSVLIFSYLSCFQKVFIQFTMIPLMFALVFLTWFPFFFVSFPLVLQKVGLTTHCFRLMYRYSYKKQDLRYTGLDKCIDSLT